VAAALRERSAGRGLDYQVVAQAIDVARGAGWRTGRPDDEWNRSTPVKARSPGTSRQGHWDVI
jgi:hypothetical protein